MIFFGQSKSEFSRKSMNAIHSEQRPVGSCFSKKQLEQYILKEIFQVE